MKILGIYCLRELSICLLENSKLKFAISEETNNRINNS